MPDPARGSALRFTNAKSHRDRRENVVGSLWLFGAGPSMEHAQILAKIIERELDGTLVSAQDVTAGYVGYVYKVQAVVGEKPGTFCVKLSPPGRDPASQIEPLDDRVYGRIPVTNFGEAYRILAGSGIPVPHLFAFGTIDIGQPLTYQVMEFLQGIEIREFLAYDEHEGMELLHEVAGQVLGKLHQITRAYDGLSGQTSPYPLDWKTAFFASLENRLREVGRRNAVIKQHAGRIERFVAQKEPRLTSPSEFVFSHNDGLQGMAKYAGGCWTFTGIVDIEDHYFVDQRFALAGHELSLYYAGRAVPASFWAGYQQFKPVPESYTSLRELFFLYYLLSWLPGCYESWKGRPESQSSTIQHFEHLILAAILGNGQHSRHH